MSPATEFEALLEQIQNDGMVVRRVVAEAGDVVFFKSVIEAYPGVAAVHAERRQAGHGDSTLARPRTLMVATTPELRTELDQLLDDLRGELPLVIDGVSTTPPREDRASG